MAQQIALPAYFDSAQPQDPVWGRVAEKRGIVGIAVFDDMNVLAGAKSQLRGSGIQVFGYVSAHKGTVERGVCAAFIDDWFARHPDLDGIYVDEGPPLDTRHPEEFEPGWVWEYYGDGRGDGIYGYIKRKKPDATVFLNCAGCRDAGIFDVCDIAGVVEDDYASYTDPAWWTGASLPWWSDPPAGKAVAHVVHSCPDDEGRSARVAVGLSKRRAATYVYVFDGAAAAYNRLPPYWDAEAAAVADTRADPCEVIADVLPDITDRLDELRGRIEHTSGQEQARLMQEAARLMEQHAEVKVILDECQGRSGAASQC